MTAKQAKMKQKLHERKQRIDVMTRHGKSMQTAQKLASRENLVLSRSSGQRSLERRMPATDARLVLSTPAPIIPSGCNASVRYRQLRKIASGGFGEVFEGTSIEKLEHVEFVLSIEGDQVVALKEEVLSTLPSGMAEVLRRELRPYVGKKVLTDGKTKFVQMSVALKRALPDCKSSANMDIDKFISQQCRKLDAMEQEAQVYFSPLFNTGSCRHLALLLDVTQVCNSDGHQEPLLVFEWADGPCASLREWLEKYPDTCATIQFRLSFAVQMCAGLRELHYGASKASTVSTTSSDKTLASELGEANPDTCASKPECFAHQDQKPENMLLFGGGCDTDGAVRLALTD